MPSPTATASPSLNGRSSPRITPTVSNPNNCPAAATALMWFGVGAAERQQRCRARCPCVVELVFQLVPLVARQMRMNQVIAIHQYPDQAKSWSAPRPAATATGARPAQPQPTVAPAASRGEWPVRAAATGGCGLRSGRGSPQHCFRTG